MRRIALGASLLFTATQAAAQPKPAVAFAPGYHRDTSTDAAQMAAYYRWATVGLTNGPQTAWPGGIVPVYMDFETAGSNTWSTAMVNMFASFWNHLTPGEARATLYNAYRPFTDATPLQGFRTAATCIRHSTTNDNWLTVMSDCASSGFVADAHGMYYQFYLDAPSGGGCSTHSFVATNISGVAIPISTICDLANTAIVLPTPNGTIYDEVFWRMTGEGNVGMFEARGYSCLSTFSNPPTDNRGCYQYAWPWWNTSEVTGYGVAATPTPGELCGSLPLIITGSTTGGLAGTGYYNYSWVDGPTTYYVQLNRFWPRTQGGHCDIVGEPTYFTVRCAQDTDCPAFSNYCDRTSGWCEPPSGFDRRKNGYETDVDCGGDEVRVCGSGKHCNLNPDCASGTCTAGVCN